MSIYRSLFKLNASISTVRCDFYSLPITDFLFKNSCYQILVIFALWQAVTGAMKLSPQLLDNLKAFGVCFDCFSFQMIHHFFIDTNYVQHTNFLVRLVSNSKVIWGHICVSCFFFMRLYFIYDPLQEKKLNYFLQSECVQEK